jgi:hypothetical protein
MGGTQRQCRERVAEWLARAEVRLRRAQSGPRDDRKRAELVAARAELDLAERCGRALLVLEHVPGSQ